MHIIEIGCGGMDRIHLVEDGHQWRALLSTVMKFRLS
jgi:hypothetical protein